MYLNAYRPYLAKREQAVLSLPVIIENSEYRLLYSKKPTDSLNGLTHELQKRS